MEFNNIEVIVFDLDGTLYEDTHHFNYYVERLALKIPMEKRNVFIHDWELAGQHKHTLQMGRVYDVLQDLILVLDEDNYKAIEAYHWNGEKISNDQLIDFYVNEDFTNFERFLTVGDLWLIAITIARHYGVTEKGTYDAFYETREYMMGPEYEMKEIKGFKECLQTLSHSMSLVLLTNSPEQDSEVILDKIGIRDIFKKKIFTGKKPYHSSKHFKDVKEEFQVPYNAILSIGDNWLNEIKPARELGCKTIYINPYNIGSVGSADAIVKNLDEIIIMLKRINTPQA